MNNKFIIAGIAGIAGIAVGGYVYLNADQGETQ